MASLPDFFCLRLWRSGFGLYKADLLFRGQELNYSYLTVLFLDHLTVPGGLLEYTGGFEPVFIILCGALIMLGVLLLIQWSVYRVLSLPRLFC